MSFERPTAGGAIGPEPAPTPGPAAIEPDHPAAKGALRLQILSTEHWSLLASRSLAWNESFSRAGMFLSALSGAIVALALVAQADQFGEGFRLFALAILPVVLLIGIGTVLRLGMANLHDAQCVMGMNRIRAAYLELDPGVERYFVMGSTEDGRGRDLTMAIRPDTPLWILMLASTPLLVTVLDAILFGAIVALLALQLGAGVPLTIALGATAFVVMMILFTWYARREMAAAPGR